jgi:hypothetical protein
MGDLEKRLGRLEARTPPSSRVRPGRVSLDEIRCLESKIKRLERGEADNAPSPEADVAASVAPDDELAAVVRKLEWLEELERAREGRPL